MNRSLSNGARLMKLAKYLMWIGIGASVVIGVLVILGSEIVHGLLVPDSSVANTLKGGLIIVCGAAVAWFLGFLLNTVGQMAKDTEDMRNGLPPHSANYRGEKPLPARAETVFETGDKLTVFGDFKAICKAFHAREHFSDD